MGLPKKLKNAIASIEIDARQEIARFDMAVGLASIARPLRHGAQPNGFITRQKWNGGDISIRGLSPDDHDLGVLLAFILLAEQQKPATQPGEEVEGLLLPTKTVNAAASSEVVTIKATYSQIRKLLGIKAGSVCSNSAIWESLTNLSTIVIDVKDGERTALTHLIKHGAATTGAALTVTLSYRLTRAMLGGGSYAAVDMTVFRALPKGAARIMYVWLASWFGGAAGTNIISLDKLAKHVWGEGKSTNEEKRKRRHCMKIALTKLVEVSTGGWVVKMNEPVEITRIRT